MHYSPFKSVLEPEYNPIDLWLEVDNPKIIGATNPSFWTNLKGIGLDMLGSFAGSQLYQQMVGRWNVLSEDLNQQWASYGGQFGGLIGSYLLPGIGTAIGNLIGSIIGGTIGQWVDEDFPRAAYLVKVDPQTGKFVSLYAYKADDGNLDIAQQMGSAAQDNLNFVMGLVGGKPISAETLYYGHYKKQLVYQFQDDAPGGSSWRRRVGFGNGQEAVEGGVIEQLKTVAIEGGDAYMKHVLTHLNNAAYRPNFGLLLNDLGIAKEYSTHKIDPLLYGLTIVNLSDEKIRDALITDWNKIRQRAQELTLDIMPGNDGGEFVAGTANNDTLDGGAGADFVWGGKGNDLLKGGDGNDRIDGGDGSDTIQGGSGDDRLFPGLPDGNSDSVDGGEGSDRLIIDYSSYWRWWDRVNNLTEGQIRNDNGKIILTHTNVENFTITGTQSEDQLKGKAGDILDGYSGKDILHLDLSNATSTVVVDITKANDQVVYGSTQVKNFETVGTITTGSGNDTIRLSIAGSSEGGTINGGAGNDLLVLDYSTYWRWWDRVSNLTVGKIQRGDDGTFLTYSNIEQFNITGSQTDDYLKASAGDILDGYNGKDKLDLDLATATTNIAVDLTQAENQVLGDGITQVKNFETIGTVTTGSGNDTIKLNINASSEGGTVNAGDGKDWLIVDYSNRSWSWESVSNLTAGKILRDGKAAYLTYSSIEQFNIIGSQVGDYLTAKAGDILDGHLGKDKLDLDLANATTNIAVDLTQAENQVLGDGMTQIKNFETIGTVTTGSGNDTIKLNREASSEGGTVNAGDGKDWLIVDYSNRSWSSESVSNLTAGKILRDRTEAYVTYSGVEQFNIKGSQVDDYLKAKVGDILDGHLGKDKLDLDLATATANITVNLTQAENQVMGDGLTQVKNFETVGNIITGSGDDTVKLTVAGSSEGGTVDTGAGNDRLILDYSTHRWSWDSISNLTPGKIDSQYATRLNYSNVEQFTIIGTQANDHLIAKNGDVVDGHLGKDKLDLDLANATSLVNIDLTKATDQVLYGSTQISNFETVGSITTGNGDDTIKLTVAGSSEQGNINGGDGRDLLILDYSTYRWSWDRLRTTNDGKIVNGNGNVFLTYRNIERFNITGTQANDQIQGGNLDDVLIGGLGNDTLTGGLGSDRFVYNSVNEGTDLITDFQVGEDLLDFRPIFQSIGYQGTNPIDDGYLQVVQSGSTTSYRIDIDGLAGSSPFRTLVTLNTTVLSTSIPDTYLFQG